MVSYAVRKLRQGLGLTQKEFAARVGVQQNTVSQYESGKIVPSPAVMLHLWQMSKGSEEEELFQAIRDDPKYAFEGQDDDPVGLTADDLGDVEHDVWPALYGEHRAFINAGISHGLKVIAGEGGDARQLNFLDLMRRFLEVADSDTIAIVENLAATRVKQHEREVAARRKERKESA